jgi:hypothetical protein
MPSVRLVVRSLTACALAIVGMGIAGQALAAQATPAAQRQGLNQESARTKQAVSSVLTVSIESMSSRFARPGSTIVVKGTVTNHTGAPISGVQVQLETSATDFPSRSVMTSYLAGSDAYFGYAPVGQAWTAPGTLHSRSAMTWTVSLPVSSAGYPRFGVYPLVAQATSGSAPPGSARTFLPYWDPNSGVPSQKLDVSWVWPLIDQPQQDLPQQDESQLWACRQTLATSRLTTSLTPGGRLGGLLAAGLQYSASTHLTWAVDPALLSDAAVMTQRYKVGGDAKCTHTTTMPASTDAATWLSQLRTGTASDPMFVTPYADPDVSALTHSGLDTDISRAYALGNDVASKRLARSFGDSASAGNASGNGSDAVAATIAWPDGGAADASVLTSLARDGQVKTTVLSSALMPLVSDGAFHPDDALAHVSTGIATPMNVLLADSDITTLLGSAGAGASPGTQFAVTQEFLAETAMITAEAPNAPRPRSLVIAPPSRWNPSAAEAATLLRLTSAPWLRPVSLATLAAKAPSSKVKRAPLPSVAKAPLELSQNYTSTVKKDRVSAALFGSLLYQPAPMVTQSLDAAVAVTESSAWRGSASPGGWLALKQLRSFLRDREMAVKIISGNKVLLAGTSGATPVSVFNGLPAPVQVKVHALVPPGSQLTITDPNTLIIVPPQTTTTVRMHVHSAALGSTQLQLQLVTRYNIPLPGKLQPFSVQATRYGRALLILIGAALGVLVLTSLARWVRRGLKDGATGKDGAGNRDGAGNQDGHGGREGARPERVQGELTKDRE